MYQALLIEVPTRRSLFLELIKNGCAIDEENSIAMYKSLKQT